VGSDRGGRRSSRSGNFEGQKAAIQAGSGGVGTFAQSSLRSNLGATWRRPGREGVLAGTSLGANVFVNYRETRFEDAVKDCDIVFDTQAERSSSAAFSPPSRAGIVVHVGGVPDASNARAMR